MISGHIQSVCAPCQKNANRRETKTKEKKKRSRGLLSGTKVVAGEEENKKMCEIANLYCCLHGFQSA